MKNVQSEKDKLNEQFEKARNAENAEQFGMTEGERVERLESLRKEKEHIDSIKKERDQLIADRATYINRIREWENNNIDPNDVIYKRLKEEVLPRTDSRISEIDQELEKVKDRDIDKEIADESEILDFNPETYSAQYDSLENYENEIKKMNVYSIDNQLGTLRKVFEVKSQEELRQEAEEARKEAEAERARQEEQQSDRQEQESQEEQQSDSKVGEISGRYKYNDKSLSAKILKFFGRDTKLLPEPQTMEALIRKVNKDSLSKKLHKRYPAGNKEGKSAVKTPRVRNANRDEERI